MYLSNVGKQHLLNFAMKDSFKTDILIGVRPLEEAISAGKSIDKVLFLRGSNSVLIKTLKDKLKAHKIMWNEVPSQKLDRITKKNHQGVIAFISPVDFYDIEEVVISCFEQGKTPFILLLDRVTDVRNFGAIIRSAEFFGVEAVVFPSRESAIINYDSIKTSAGAIFNVKLCKVGSLKNVVSYLKKSGLQVFSITEKGDENLSAKYLKMPTALVLGSEEDGVSPEILKISEKKIRINGKGKTSSLNVAVAASIALHAFSFND